MLNKAFRLLCVLATFSLFSNINTGAPALAANDPFWEMSFQPKSTSSGASALNRSPYIGYVGPIENCKNGLPGLANGKCGDDNLDFGILFNTMADCSLAPSVSCIASLEIFQSRTWERASYLGPVSDSSERSLLPQPRWDAFADLDIGPSNHSAVYKLGDSFPGHHLWVLTVDYRFSHSDIANPGKRSYNVSVIPVERISPCSGSRTIYINETECYQVLDISTGFKTRLTFDLRYKPSGWISTYLRGAAAKSLPSPRSPGRYELSVEGESTWIPSSSVRISYSDVDRRERLCATWSSQSGFCSPDNTMSWGLPMNTLGGQGIQRKYHFENFTKYVGLFPEMDQATTENQFWVFTFTTSETPSTDICSQQNGIYGLAGGNSMVISDEIPIWNKITKSLEFTVASPHYRPNGETAQGFYEMQLNQQVANCLWGTKITPLNVSLSVLDAQGDAKVATSQVTVKDGVVLFRATGFTYSTTKLRATLKGAAKVKAKQLVCSKKGITKIQPKKATSCPKGWKKK